MTKKFTKKGIQAEFVNQVQEEEGATAAVIKGDIQLVFIISKNLLCSFLFWKMLFLETCRDNLRALAVDEAHCINQ